MAIANFEKYQSTVLYEFSYFNRDSDYQNQTSDCFSSQIRGIKMRSVILPQTNQKITIVFKISKQSQIFAIATCP